MAIVSYNFALDGFQYPINTGWLSTFGEIDFDGEEPVVLINPRYWISGSPSNWANSANWSETSGGPGGATIPTPRNVAVFDTSGLGSCTMDASAFVYGIYVNGYSGTISQNNKDIVCSFASFFSGTFEGDGSNISTATDFAVGGTCDFTSTDGTVSCDGTFLFAPSTGTFYHNNGAVSLDGTGAYLNAPNITLSKLQLNASQARINRALTVEDQLHLQRGGCRKIQPDATVHLKGDLYSGSNYNQWSIFNDFPIEFDSTTKQTIFNQNGSVTPSVLVNKTVSDQVILEGRSPFVIKDELRIQDGTFNSNGINLQVGL